MSTKGTVSGVIANMVTLKVDGPVAQNEICYIETGGDKLMSEVIKVVGENLRSTIESLQILIYKIFSDTCKQVVTRFYDFI